jgi:peptidoglycan/xylan/chitin deacetylase (PgdA/CDA1 family)
MLHRFRSEMARNPGHDPEALRQTLAWLRRHDYTVVDLEALYRRLAGEGPPLRRTVAFALDDGYVEQAEIAARVFAEFEAPSTTFLATGFLDGKLWFWWDQIEFVLARTRRPRLAVTVGDRPVDLDLTCAASRDAGQAQFTEYCKTVPEVQKQEAIARLAAQAEVELPREPPGEYRPMSWEQARGAERLGMRFGAQTVTHPILSRTDAEQSRNELHDSWRRVVQELERPVPVFCYPNGQDGDFGAREIAVLEELGFIGELASSEGYAETVASRQPHGRFRLPRFPFSDSPRLNIQVASGVERMKSMIRRLAHRRSQAQDQAPLTPLSAGRSPSW